MESARRVPWSRETEMAVLCACFMSPDAIPEVRVQLEPTHFYHRGHRVVYEAILETYDEGEAADGVTVFQRLDDQGVLHDIGGDDLLRDIMDAGGSPGMVDRYAKVVRDKAALRDLTEKASEIIREATEATDRKPSEVIAAAQERILGTARSQQRAGGFRDASAGIVAAMESIEEARQSKGGVVGIPTGFATLDRWTTGLRPGGLTVLAARPRMGKSAMGWEMARKAAKHTGVAIASYEMTLGEIYTRALSQAANLDSHQLRSGRVDEVAYRTLANVAGTISRLPIFADDRPPRTMEQLRANVIRLRHHHEIGLVVVDYLQHMEAAGQNRNAEIEKISRGMKALAMDLGVHVLALSQLNRKVDDRPFPRPQLSDLRDSGAIEQDADNVLLLWRPEEYHDETTDQEEYGKWQGKAELIVAKQRASRTGSILLDWDGPTTTFTEPTHDRPEEDPMAGPAHRDAQFHDA